MRLPTTNTEFTCCTAGVSDDGSDKIKKVESENFKVYFVDVTDRLAVLSEELHLRDYYSCATYFRIFIAMMFPEYDKAIYLDSDIVVRCDLAEYFDTELGDNYVAGVPDGAVGAVPYSRNTRSTCLASKRKNISTPAPCF